MSLMMAALYSLGNLLYSLFIELQSFSSFTTTQVHSKFIKSAPYFPQVLQPLQVQLVDLIRSQDDHVHQHLRTHSSLFQNPLNHAQHFLGQRFQLRAWINSLFPAEVRLAVSEEHSHQLHRTLHNCHFCSQPLLFALPPYVNAHLRVVYPLSGLLWRFCFLDLFLCVGRIVLDVDEHLCFSGGCCFAEGEECLVRLVLNAPALALEVGFVVRVLDDDLALRVDDLLLQLLQKLLPAPLASAEQRSRARQQRVAQSNERKQGLGPYQHANQFQHQAILRTAPIILNQMKSFLYLLLSLLLAAFLFYAYYDPSKEYVSAVSQRECLNQQASKVFCAQCLRRSKQPALHPEKAFLIDGAEHYALLKIPSKAEHLACHEYLHLADYAKADQGMRLPLQLEQIGSVIALMGELQGQFVGDAAGESVVGAGFEQVVIYRWFSIAEEKSTTVRVADSSQLQSLRKVQFCLVNAVILLLGGLYLRNKESFSHLKPKVLACIGLLLAALDVLAFNLVSDNSLLLVLVRQLVLASCLMRVEASSGSVCFMVFVGLLSSLVSFGYLLNLVIVLVIVIAKGSNEQNVREIWRYIMGSLLVYTADHLAWQLMFLQSGDTGCQFVEMLVLGLTPLGLTLIKDAKYVGFKVYKGEQKRHAISLSGYEEEEQQEEQI